jgi:hypothetical protein
VGLGLTYSPFMSGRCLLLAAGNAQNSGGAANNTQLFGFYGTGAAPVAGASLGSALGQFGQMQRIAGGASVNWVGFTVMGFLNLSTSQTYWFDVVISTDGGAGGGVRDTQLILIET